MTLVSLVRTGTQRSEVYAAIGKSIDLIGFELPKNAKNVVIKPNMCYYWDNSTGETTDPRFVGALVDLLRDRIARDIKISVVESDASAMKCCNAFRMLGYERMAFEKMVSLVNLTLDGNEKIRVHAGKRFFNFGLARTIKNADLFVNVPKIKYMPQTRISCALKNMYGCNPNPKKFLYHAYLDEVIVGLNTVLKADLCVVDGIVVRGEQTRRLGLVMSSSDPVAIDSVGARIAGLNPRRINHIVLAEKAGLGRMRCKTVGEDIGYFAKRFPSENSKARIQSSIIGLGVTVLKKLGRYAE